MPTGRAKMPTTFLATDIEGSTRLWSARPDEMARLTAVHDRLVNEIFERFSGSSVKRLWEGDSTFASFRSAGDALAAGIQIQREISQLQINGEPLKVRVAIHAADCDGDPLLLAGAELNRTLKMRSVAHGGQILVSHPVVVEAAGKIPEGADLHDLGWHRLAYGSDRVRLFQLSPSGAAGTFPPPRTIESSPNNIGIQLTTFVGRVQARASIASMLLDPQPFAICGMPGIGKSRLAREAASDMLGVFPDGIWVVDAPNIVEPGDLWDQLKELVPGARRADASDIVALAIVDGEIDGHLLDICARAVPDGVRIMTTSCFPPKVVDDRVVMVAPLSLDVEEGEGLSEAARVFVDRAQERVPGVDLASWAEVIERIVTHLGGVPLAIETVAAKMTAMNPKAILDRLIKDGSMLWGTSRLVDRSSALLATFESAFSKLTTEEVATLTKLGEGKGDGLDVVPERLIAGGLVEVVEGMPQLPPLVLSYLQL